MANLPKLLFAAQWGNCGKPDVPLHLDVRLCSSEEATLIEVFINIGLLCPSQDLLSFSGYSLASAGNLNFAAWQP